MVSRGPWTGDARWHNDEVHERWLRLLNRPTGALDYRDEWYDAQCGGCRFWIALSGELGRDWGACTRATSMFDGQMRFEHDGCPSFMVRADRSFG
ncbi:DUF3027 domain-containing protein [Streptomyces sp. WZ.A104]|uniref:DUF3027 domain-containing protein n=1 Tax=Streptomyces sp. WZ.A104 TaxID=2023771 RepID=UPI000D1A48D9|nr:DUF3027 domain-containing protein [Streptomyces sp. WZ.A104]